MLSNHSNAFEINQLKKELTRYEKELTERDTHLRDLEKQLQAFLDKNYELRDAVQEIRQMKAEKKRQDERLEELAHYASNNEVMLQELLEENEELRARLGLEPRKTTPINELREGQGKRIEGYRAQIRLLERDVR